MKNDHADLGNSEEKQVVGPIYMQVFYEALETGANLVARKCAFMHIESTSSFCLISPRRPVTIISLRSSKKPK